MTIEPDATVDCPERLSADEATELAGQVASLAKSGLPLESGLRALADEIRRGRLAGVLRRMAGRLEAGTPLEEVIRRQGQRFPAHVRGLLLAGIRSGQLPEVLEEFVDLHRSHRELRRRIWLTLAYPIVLLSILSGLFVFFDLFIVDQFAQIFRDFECPLPIMTEMVLSVSKMGSWVLAGGTALSVLAVALLTTTTPAAPVSPQLLYKIPLIGPLWRWSRLLQFARLMNLLLGQGTPLPDALRLTATGVQDAYLGAGCLRVAHDVEAGRALSESMASLRQFPPTMIPLIDWGQHTSALPDAFDAAAEIFEGNVRAQAALMETSLAPIVFLIVTVLLSFFITAMFLPLIALIEMLT